MPEPGLSDPLSLFPAIICPCRLDGLRRGVLCRELNCVTAAPPPSTSCPSSLLLRSRRRCFFAAFSFFSRSFLRSARSFLAAALSLFFSSFFLFFSSSCFFFAAAASSVSTCFRYSFSENRKRLHGRSNGFKIPGWNHPPIEPLVVSGAVPRGVVPLGVWCGEGLLNQLEPSDAELEPTATDYSAPLVLCDPIRSHVILALLAMLQCPNLQWAKIRWTPLPAKLQFTFQVN